MKLVKRADPLRVLCSAGSSGTSLVLVGPEDQKSYRKLCLVLNKGVEGRLAIVCLSVRIEVAR